MYTDDSEGLLRQDAPKLTNITESAGSVAMLKEVTMEKEHLYSGCEVRSQTAVEFLREHRFPRLYLSECQMLLSL